MKTTVRIEGGAALRRVLQGLGRRLGRNAATAALRAGGRVLAESAKAKVSVRKGELKKSIKVDRKAKFAEPDPNPHVFVGPTSDMAARGSWEEFGTINQAPDPFLRPALEQDGQRAATVVGERLAAEIAKRQTSSSE